MQFNEAMYLFFCYLIGNILRYNFIYLWKSFRFVNIISSSFTFRLIWLLHWSILVAVVLLVATLYQLCVIFAHTHTHLCPVWLAHFLSSSSLSNSTHTHTQNSVCLFLQANSLVKFSCQLLVLVLVVASSIRANSRRSCCCCCCNSCSLFSQFSTMTQTHTHQSHTLNGRVSYS